MPAAEALVGAVLDGSYRIEGLLGEGGMGAVYRATHLRLDKCVAVKVMARELAANPDALLRFHREALVTSGLGHPHIVQVFDFSTTPSGEPFMVMEFLEGEDLERRLRRVGRLPAPQVARIVRQVAAALAATHAKAIVHRDLKPGNIYLLEIAGEPDFVKVLDFGISKVRSATTKLTRTASVMGTPNYMSPEQARGKTDEIDERTDQWALACIAWECLSGEGPFIGENVPSILFQIVHEPPPALLPKVSGLHPQVEDVLLRALAKDKRQRFAGVGDFAEALEAAVSGAGQAEAAAASVRPPTMKLFDAEAADSAPPAALPSTFMQTAGELDEDLDELPRRPKWVWGAVVAAVSALALGGYLLLRPGPVARPVPASPPPAVSAPVVSPIPQPAPTAELPAVPAAAVSEPTTQPEPAAAAPKADGRRRESRPKAAAGLPGAGPSPANLLEPPKATAVGPPDDPFEHARARASWEARRSPPASAPDDPFERRAKKPESPVGVPASGRKAARDNTDKPADSARPRSKEDQWRVD
jgi:serine/threonine-protein kinase